MSDRDDSVDELRQYIRGILGDVYAIDEDDLIGWIAANMKPSHIWPDGHPEIQAAIDEAVENADSHAANETDVNRSLRPNPRRL